jgi:predicted cytidylate kinase
MAHPRSIVVSGDLGSGKSTVTSQLAARLGLRKVSMGELYREIAQERGMSALQINLYAERDEAVDNRVDQLQKQMASSNEQMVVDSRLAWFFFTNALKVHLVVDPTVAAQRVMSRPADEVEAYSSVEEAIERLQSRSESERARFLKKYSADKTRLRNYDLICDTTRAGQDEIVQAIMDFFHGTLGGGTLTRFRPLLLLDPSRIYPTRSVVEAQEFWETGAVAGRAGPGPGELEPISVGYANPYYYVVNGHRRLSAAIHGGFTLVPAELAAENGEEVAGGLSAVKYFEAEVSRSVVYEWADAHRIHLPLPAHLASMVEATEG